MLFSFFFSNNFYKFVKSGMLLDFFFKKIIFNIIYKYFIISNILFSEKFFIEYNFLKSQKFINFFFKINEFFQKQFSISSLSVIIFLLIIILFFIN
jgi:hypothetical protein